MFLCIVDKSYLFSVPRQHIIQASPDMFLHPRSRGLRVLRRDRLINFLMFHKRISSRTPSPSSGLPWKVRSRVLRALSQASHSPTHSRSRNGTTGHIRISAAVSGSEHLLRCLQTVLQGREICPGFHAEHTGVPFKHCPDLIVIPQRLFRNP